jgi:TonB family protein
MTRTRISSGLISLLLIGGPGALSSKPASGQEQTSIATAPANAAPVIRHGHLDPKRPLHVGADYYPKEAVRHHEQGRCVLAFYIQADGSVPAAQLVKSSGYSHLNTACIQSVINVPMLPGTVDGTPVAGWSDFPIGWVIDHAEPYQPPPEKSAVPRVADDYELHVGDKYYPEAARAKHERGYCVVHTTVGSTGTAFNAAITRSTGSAILDQACLAAVKDARFAPELQDGHPVADSTDIAIYW